VLSGLNTLSPVSFNYNNDSDLSVNQTPFATQQGLNLNFVSLLSSCRDEAVLNYSNTFLSDLIDINDCMQIAAKQSIPLRFSTYFAFNSYPSINIASSYLQIISNPGNISALTFVNTLCDSLNSYFVFSDVDGISCKISTIDNSITKFLTVDPATSACIFSVETSAITAISSNRFEYALDNSGFLKLFYRGAGTLCTVSKVNNSLSAVPIAVINPFSTILTTSYKPVTPPNIRNNFVYYDGIKNFKVNSAKSISTQQNYAAHYEHESQSNFQNSVSAGIDFFKLKNTLSDNYWINDTLPFDKKTVQRRYSNILSKQNSEKFAADLQFNYAYYTKEYYFAPDITTKFTLPDSLYPYLNININDSSLALAGSYGGMSPVFSDKIFKQNDVNLNLTDFNNSNGLYLFSWLYTSSNQLTSYWVDRYYYPKSTSLTNAYTGASYQIFSYVSDLSAYLSLNSVSNFLYYDIKSSQVLEPLATYYYSRIGSNYIEKVVSKFATALSSLDSSYFTISNPSNAFSVAFNLNCDRISNVKTPLLVGNNFDEGVSVYKGGTENIFTPGYFISTDKLINFYDIDDALTFTLNLSTYVGSSVKILDVVNTGFDHPQKVFYVNTANSYPGFIDFSLDGKVLNKVEFSNLANKFDAGISGKTYIGNANIIYYNTNGALTSAYNFDYINNTHDLGTVYANPSGCFVSFNSSLCALSGTHGVVFGKYGVSKANNVIYFRNLATGIYSEYVALSTSNAVFDLQSYNNLLYVQTNTKVSAIDSLKNVVSTFYLNTSAVSGLAIDFINKDFSTKLLSYSVDISGRIIVDTFNIDTTKLESTFATNLTAISSQYQEIANNINTQLFTPVNFTTINSINKFDTNDIIVRADLFSGNNYKNKTTQIIGSSMTSNQRLLLSFDPTNGIIKLYIDGVLTNFASISANTFLNSYFLANTFGVGVPYIGNIPVTSLIASCSCAPMDYQLANFKVYNNALTDDEAKFDSLLNKRIQGINFDVPQGTRNNTDSIASFNKFLIPGRKNNNIKVYIKNLNLSQASQLQLISLLQSKLVDVLPANTNNVEFDFSINNE
jgi:hypothetical protein